MNDASNWDRWLRDVAFFCLGVILSSIVYYLIGIMKV